MVHANHFAFLMASQIMEALGDSVPPGSRPEVFESSRGIAERWLIVALREYALSLLRIPCAWD